MNYTINYLSNQSNWPDFSQRSLPSQETVLLLGNKLCRVVVITASKQNPIVMGISLVVSTVLAFVAQQENSSINFITLAITGSVTMTSVGLITLVFYAAFFTLAGKICALFLEKCYQIEPKSELDLFFIAKKRNNFAEKELQKYNPNSFLSCESITGNTPIHWAIANGNWDVARVFIQVGPVDQLFIRNEGEILNHKNSPLHLVIAKGYINITKSGQKINTSCYDLVEQSLKKAETRKGELLSLKNDEGNTLLHLAYLRRDKRMISLLTKNGASEKIANKYGKTPKEMANLGYSQACAKLCDTCSPAYLLEKETYETFPNIHSDLEIA